MSENYNIWNLYGLRGNPFSTDPLSMYAGELPIEQSFLGRAEEIRKMKKIIYSNKTSRILVYGDIGIGKTSFVNYVKYEAVKDGYFTPLGELSLVYTWSPEDFMFNTISMVWSAIERNIELKNRFDSGLTKKLNVIFGIDRGGSFGGGIAVLGSVDRGDSYGVPRFNSHTLKLLLQDIVDELMRLGFKGLIIHYNNLELVQDKNEGQLKRIMNGIRDFMQVQGVHFVFVSDKTLYEVFQQIPRVEEIFQVPVLLLPLQFGEIEEIIKKRIQLLAIEGTTPMTPYGDEALRILFDLYSGNLRGVLRSLDCAVSEAAVSRPIKISAAYLKASLFKYAQNRFLREIGSNDANTLKILRRILDKRETTNKLLAEHFGMLPQNVSASLTKLRDAGVIRLSREEGRSRYYVPSQEALWLLLQPAPGAEGGQATL